MKSKQSGSRESSWRQRQMTYVSFQASSLELCNSKKQIREQTGNKGEIDLAAQFVWNEVTVCSSNDIRCPDMTAINGREYLCKQKQ